MLSGSRTISAPTPGGPPSLWAERAIKSASGSAIFPAACTASTSNRLPVSRTSAATSASGWITPVSLFAACTATSAGPSDSAARKAARSIWPLPSTGSSTTSSRACSTALCSVAPTSKRGRVGPASRAPFDANVIASVPPLVNTTCSGATPAKRATVSRAPSSSALAARPPPCTLDGFPTNPSASTTAARTASLTGVVAA